MYYLSLSTGQEVIVLQHTEEPLPVGTELKHLIPTVEINVTWKKKIIILIRYNHCTLMLVEN